MAEQLTASQARLQDDLRGIVRGDARCDDLVLQLYSSDGSPFEERPLGVVWPRSVQDVASVAQYAAEKKISIHPRGSGTSAVAGAIGSGLILDFSRYMRRVLQAGDDFVRVQPGAVRERVNDLLRTTKGRFFAPSSGHIPTGTIGGVLATNVLGPRWLRYGAPSESVLELKIVSSSGKIWELRPLVAHPQRGAIDSQRGAASFRRKLLNAALAEARAAGSDDKSDFDLEFELLASGKVDSSEYGIDFGDGAGLRSFRSEYVRAEFFKRVFGKDAIAFRELMKEEPWTRVVRVLREFESNFDSPEGEGGGLRDVLRNGFDPTRFFVGSEGTLGIVAEAKLTTFAVSNVSCSSVLLFESLEKATNAVSAVLEYEPTLCDLLDSRIVALTRDWDSRFETILPQAAQAALVVELDETTPEKLRRKIDDLSLRARERLESFGGRTAFSQEERSLFRDLLRKSSCARLRMAPSFQSFPYWEDVRLPIGSIPDFLRDVQKLFKRERIVYSVGGFVGCGQLSIQPILPYSEDEEQRVFALTEDFENYVLKYGGEIGCSKGLGRLRTASTSKRFPNLSHAFVKIKDAFDPANRLNPDCIVSPELRRLAEKREKKLSLDSNLSNDELRKKQSATLVPKKTLFSNDSEILSPEISAVLRESSLNSRSIIRRVPFDLERLERDSKIDWLNRPKRSQLEFQTAWNPTLVYASTYQCVGCGHCRIRTQETRMCPAFRHTPDESSSCRAKANLLRGVLDGKTSLETLTNNEVKRIADRCVRCHCCSIECPAQVDASKLTFRLQSAYRAAVGLGLHELFAVRTDFVFNLATYLSKPINKGMRNPVFRWIIEKILGVAQGRKTPLLENRPYLRGVKRSSSINDALNSLNVDVSNAQTARKNRRRKVALFIDSYANFFDAKLVEATVRVLELNDIEVTLPSKPRVSGAVAFAIGDVDRAEDFATRNVSLFREITRDGSEILTLEPSSAVCIKKEYPYFCNDADAQVVYQNTTDVCSYLARLDRAGELNRERLRPVGETPLTIGYHAPCRSIALSGAALPNATPAQTLLELIPGLQIKRLERGCCGFAGFSGFTKKRFYESLQLGAKLFLAMRTPEIDVCSSECSFCNLQLAQGVAKPVAHALKLLAVSYGVMDLKDAYERVFNARPPKKKRS